MARSSNEMSMEVDVSDDVTLWSATRLEAAIRSRELSSWELLTAYQRRVAALNPRINAIVTLDYPRAQEAAARADEAAARGQWLGPLHGLPFTVKDAIETAGLRSTGGAPELASHVPTTDAPAVSRLSSAGGILFGKTNAPRWSADIQTHNDLFGVTRNPWDLDRTTGGSSGGAAAAVASGMTGFELGTDIGGSIRLPSSFCGVYGHKPSYGIISQRGYLDHAGGGTTDADVNVFGPIARSVEDLELLFGVLAAPDAEDAAAWRLDVPPPAPVPWSTLASEHGSMIRRPPSSPRWATCSRTQSTGWPGPERRSLPTDRTSTWPPWSGCTWGSSGRPPRSAWTRQCSRRWAWATGSGSS